MKAIVPVLCALVLAGCAAAPAPRVEPANLAQRVGLPADAPYSTHRCSYAQVLMDDEVGDFVAGATCAVFGDRLAILRSRDNARPAFFRYQALEGVGLTAHGRRTQLQLLAAGQVVVVEMDAIAPHRPAQERVYTTAQLQGVPAFHAEFVEARPRRTVFVPPAF
jgi:hypothetical protein